MTLFLLLVGLWGEILDCSTVPSAKGTPSPKQVTLSLLMAQSSPSSQVRGSPEGEFSFLTSWWGIWYLSAFCLCFSCGWLSFLSPLTATHTLLCNVIKLNKKEEKIKQCTSSFPSHLTFPSFILFEPFCHHVALWYTISEKKHGYNADFEAVQAKEQ